MSSKLLFLGICFQILLISGLSMYQPMKRGIVDKKERIKYLEAKKKKSIAGESGIRKQLKKEVLTNTIDFLTRLYEYDHIYRDRELKTYFKDLLSKIGAANPELKIRDLNIYVTDIPFANAFTVLNDRIYINIGLIDEMDTPEQIAFVLCHELAHYHLSHSAKAIDDYVSYWSSDKVKKEVDKIVSDARSIKKSSEFMKQYRLDGRVHSRFKEFEADQIGFGFYVNLGLDPAGAYAVMDVLDKTDELDPVDDIFPAIFEFEEYPIPEPEKEGGSIGAFFSQKKEEVKKENAEKLRTHPECTKRKEKMKSYSSGQKAKVALDQEAYNKIKSIATYERILAYMREGVYELALHRILTEMKKQPDDPFLVYSMGLLLNNLGDGRSSYKMGDLLETRSDFYDNTHKKLHSFLDNLTSKDFDHLAYYYLKSKKEIVSKYPLIQEEWEHACKNTNNKF